jgi:hypothetical protein
MRMTSATEADALFKASRGETTSYSSSSQFCRTHQERNFADKAVTISTTSQTTGFAENDVVGICNFLVHDDNESHLQSVRSLGRDWQSVF